MVPTGLLELSDSLKSLKQWLVVSIGKEMLKSRMHPTVRRFYELWDKFGEHFECQESYGLIAKIESKEHPQLAIEFIRHSPFANEGRLQIEVVWTGEANYKKISIELVEPTLLVTEEVRWFFDFCMLNDERYAAALTMCQVEENWILDPELFAKI